MTDRRLMFIDIEPKSNSSAPVSSQTHNHFWSNSDNAFTFNFLPDDCPAAQSKTSPPKGGPEPLTSQKSFAGQGSNFAFNFKIPPEEHMETTQTSDTSSPGGQKVVQEEKPTSSAEPAVRSKAKKNKKKSGKKSTDSSEPQKESSSAERNLAVEDTELSTEEQLNRQLDWCIEQLEVGMRSQKGTPKQKEETSWALKTLRSSKAPLAKKRQVMRTMTGDYRKKMEDEKKKQYKLIQSEVASARVRVVSDSPKKCVFHRRAGVKTHTSATEETLQQAEAQTSQTQEGSSAFVFVPSKEEFHFHFL